MITPYHIFKKIYHDDKSLWKEILLYSFLLSITFVFSSFLFFLKAFNIINLPILTFILNMVLSFNAIFLFINAIKYLLKKPKKKKISELFARFEIKKIINLILLSLLYLTIFAVCFVFPNLILSQIAQIIGPGFMNFFLYVTDIILMAIGFYLIFIALAFAPILIIDLNNKKYTFNKIIKKSHQLSKKNQVSIFLNRIFLIILNFSFIWGVSNLLLSQMPDEWLIILSEAEWLQSTNNFSLIPISFIIAYLLSILIIFFILLIINLVYESNFYLLYKKRK